MKTNVCVLNPEIHWWGGAYIHLDTHQRHRLQVGKHGSVESTLLLQGSSYILDLVSGFCGGRCKKNSVFDSSYLLSCLFFFLLQLFLLQLHHLQSGFGSATLQSRLPSGRLERCDATTAVWVYGLRIVYSAKGILLQYHFSTIDCNSPSLLSSGSVLALWQFHWEAKLGLRIAFSFACSLCKNNPRCPMRGLF